MMSNITTHLGNEDVLDALVDDAIAAEHIVALHLAERNRALQVARDAALRRVRVQKRGVRFALVTL